MKENSVEGMREMVIEVVRGWDHRGRKHRGRIEGCKDWIPWEKEALLKIFMITQRAKGRTQNILDLQW